MGANHSKQDGAAAQNERRDDNQESMNSVTKTAFCKLSGCEGVAVDAAGAVALLQQRVTEGDGDAEWMLGMCYEYGIGIDQDVDRSRQLYASSRDKGNAVAEFLTQNGQRGDKAMTCDGLWQ